MLRYTSKQGNKYELLVKPEALRLFRNGELSSDEAVSKRQVYKNSKYRRLASQETIETDFGTLAACYDVMLREGELRIYSENVLLDWVLDVGFFVEFAFIVYAVWQVDVAFEFSIACLQMVGLITATVWFSRYVATFLSSIFLAKFDDPLGDATALRQFISQTWQLIIHVYMTYMGYVALVEQQGKLDGQWLIDTPKAFLRRDAETLMYDKYDSKQEAPAMYDLYIAQLAVWLVTLVCHRFVDSRSKDYYVMYTHHVVTICCVLISFIDSALMFYGLAIFYLHDFSDIFCDAMKLLNLLRFENARGFFLAEVAWVLCVLAFAYYRLYEFPVKIIYYALYGNLLGYEEGYMCYDLRQNLDDPAFVAENPVFTPEYVESLCWWKGPWIGSFGLIALTCMHTWWTWLLLRIGYRVVITGDDIHDVSTNLYFENNAEKVNKRGAAAKKVAQKTTTKRRSSRKRSKSVGKKKSTPRRRSSAASATTKRRTPASKRKQSSGRKPQRSSATKRKRASSGRRRRGE